MSKTLQLLGGTTAQNNAFTGAVREVTVDTQTHELRVHDGSTAGGFIIPTKSEVQTLLGGGTPGTLLANSGTAGTVNSVSIDSSPTDESTNPVSSGGVYNSLASVVHLSGSETITGNKTFKGNGISFERSSDTNNRGFMYKQESTGDMALGIQNSDNSAWQNYIQFNTNGNISITSNASGASVTTKTPSSTTSTSSAQIATTGWVNTTGNNIVHLTNNETITGKKTFSDIQKLNANTLKCFSIARGTVPGSTQYANYYFTDSAELNGDNNAFGLLRTQVNTSGNVSVYLRAFKNNVAGTNVYSDLSLMYPASGNPYASAPASDVANSIVTTVNKSKAAKGYFQLGNGLIVNWGTMEPGSGISVTFAKAFTSTNFTVTGSTLGTSSGFFTVSSQTTSGFVGNNSAATHWIAIGY